MKLDLDALEALEAEATKGPWKVGQPHGADKRGYSVNINAPHHAALAEVVWTMIDDILHGKSSPEKEANAKLIAALRNAAPDLIKAARMLERAKASVEILHKSADRRYGGSTPGSISRERLGARVDALAEVLSLLTAPQGDGDGNV